MTRNGGVIPVEDPAKIGLALRDVRVMLGRSQRGVAMGIARRTGRDAERVRTQIWAWETLRMVPDLPSIEQFTKELGIGLAFTLNGDDEEGAL